MKVNCTTGKSEEALSRGLPKNKAMTGDIIF